jgi:hypothetical protein
MKINDVMITQVYNTMRQAIKVVTLDPELHALLREKDPKALAQLEAAAVESDWQAETVRAREELL